MTEEIPRKEKLSFTGMRVLIAAVVVVGLVFLGDALDDGGESASVPVWPVVRAADGSCRLAAQPFPRAAVVRFSALCDLSEQPLVLTLGQTKSREKSANGKSLHAIEPAFLNPTGDLVGQVFHGAQTLGRCRVRGTGPVSILCSPTGTGPFQQRVQVRVALRVPIPECGPRWVLTAKFGTEEDPGQEVAPVIWRGCGTLPPAPSG